MTPSTDPTSTGQAADIERVLAVFSEVLEIETVGSEDDFFGLGGDSFDAIRATSRIDKTLKVVALFENPTAKALVAYMAGNDSAASPRLVRMTGQSDGTADLLVVGVPYGGGDPVAYMDLFKADPGTDVYGVDFGDLDPQAEGAFDAFVATTADEIAALKAKRVVIYGHCAGSATAACLAGALEQRGVELALVVAASRPTTDPDLALAAMETTSNADWAAYLRSLGGFVGLSDAECDAMLSRGRRDHRIATEAYRRLQGKAAGQVPALVLLGDADPATEETVTVLDLWSQRVNVVETATITGGGHYFLRSHRDAVERNILSFSQAKCLEGAL